MSTERDTAKIMARVNELYQNRDLRAKELRSQGKKVVGYFCIYPPIEFLTALDLVPYRIMGSVTEPITEGDAYLETIMCPFARSCFDLSLKGGYNFLDGFVGAHSCDTILRLYDIWIYYNERVYTHFINVPHMVHPSSYEFFKKELGVYWRDLERFTGTKLSPVSLQEAVRLHNESRSLLRELYCLRKEDPPLISGTEVVKTIVAGMTIPVQEYNELLRGVIKEVRGRQSDPEKNHVRLLIYGTVMDNAAFVQLVEEAGGNVVMDDLCTGSRGFWRDVPVTNDPLDGLAEYYLGEIRCPRTYRPKSGTAPQDVAARFNYLLDYAKAFRVSGVIVYVMRFCDTHELDAPVVMDYLRSHGLPVLYLEDDYNVATIVQLRTRVQAFLETIS